MPNVFFIGFEKTSFIAMESIIIIVQYNISIILPYVSVFSISAHFESLFLSNSRWFKSFLFGPLVLDI